MIAINHAIVERKIESTHHICLVVFSADFFLYIPRAILFVTIGTAIRRNTELKVQQKNQIVRSVDFS